MQLKDWGRLFNGIEWEKCNEDGVIIEDKAIGRRKTHIIRIEFSDGRIMEDKNVSSTYCSFIREIGAEEVSILDISHAGVNIVSKELDVKYSDYQRNIGNGWYVMTNSPTTVKYHDILKIIDEYGLDIKVSLVSLEISTTSTFPKTTSKSRKREKIKVKFPNGKIIQPSKVFEALLEVVRYAGAESVQSLGIVCCGNNLILKKPTPRYVRSSKPVGDGWLCNTCSDTRTKYDQIKTISDKLSLRLEVELK